jgi:hypothetical protein
MGRTARVVGLVVVAVFGVLPYGALLHGQTTREQELRAAEERRADTARRSLQAQWRQYLDCLATVKPPSSPETCEPRRPRGFPRYPGGNASLVWAGNGYKWVLRGGAPAPPFENGQRVYDLVTGNPIGVFRGGAILPLKNY